MRRLILAMVFGLVLAACGGGSDVSTTIVGGTADTGDTTTTAADTSTTVGDPVTTTTLDASAGEGGADCIVGTWEMDSDRFFEAIEAEMTPEEAAAGGFTYVGGSYRAILGSDGSFTDQRDEWSFDVGSDDGVMNMTLNHERTGTYEVTGGTIAISLPGDVPADITMTIDGQPFSFPPGVPQPSAPAFDYDTAPFDCSRDSLTLQGDDGFTVYWTRVG